MSDAQDTITKAQTEPDESLKDVVQNKISPTENDALRDSALDRVSGGIGGSHSTMSPGPGG